MDRRRPITRLARGTHSRKIIRETEEVQHGTMQKPWLGDARRKVYTHRLDNDLANEVSLGFGIPIFRRETRFEDNVERSADVDLVYLPVDGHADVLLLSMEQDGERGGPRSGVGGAKFARGDAVVCAVLREEGREIVIDESAEICGERSSLERADDRGKDAGELDEELLVVACDP